MINTWVYYAEGFIFIIPINPHSTPMRWILVLVQFDIWSKSDLVMLKDSTVKSLKADPLIL